MDRRRCGWDRIYGHDLRTGDRSAHDLGPGRHPGAITFVPDPTRRHRGDGGWLIGLVHDGVRNKAVLIVLDARDRPTPDRRHPDPSTHPLRDPRHVDPGHLITSSTPTREEPMHTTTSTNQFTDATVCQQFDVIGMTCNESEHAIAAEGVALPGVTRRHRRRGRRNRQV